MSVLEIPERLCAGPMRVLEIPESLCVRPMSLSEIPKEVCAETVVEAADPSEGTESGWAADLTRCLRRAQRQGRVRPGRA